MVTAIIVVVMAMCGILLDHSGGIIQSRARSKRNIKENALRFEALKAQGFSAILVATGAYHCVSLNTEGDACPSSRS